ncbi:MAG TPA: hypothetical protein VFE50_06015 [Cyclobacteriaceae bacterium]|nr:hypothetical protein [Cyclobacteriaceae bacterium]
MRRLTAAVLLSLILFNVIGYYGVYLGLRAKANSDLRQQLDANNFDESETITIRVPLALPYQSDWSSFQRVDGDFEKDGEFYNLVKQKIERDTLIIIAVKDHREATLFESLTNYVQSHTDTPLSEKAGKMIDNLAKDFLFNKSELTVDCIGWFLETSFEAVDYSVLTAATDVHSPPPRA